MAHSRQCYYQRSTKLVHSNLLQFNASYWYFSFFYEHEKLIFFLDDGCIGMAFFEFNDERTKVDDLQKTMGAVAFEENIVDGKSSVEPNVWHVDTLVRKEGIFDAIKSGILNGKPYNFNANEFELIGRAKDVLNAQQCVAPEPTWTTTTGVVGTTSGTTGSTTGSVPATTTTGSEPSTTAGSETTTSGTTGSVGSTTGNVPATTTGTPQNPGSTTGSVDNLENSSVLLSVNIVAILVAIFVFVL